MYAATLGAMQMPAGFKYKDILRRGRPRHEKYDSFWLKHPPMSPSRWAKIFAPFDALDGFDGRIMNKRRNILWSVRLWMRAKRRC